MSVNSQEHDAWQCHSYIRAWRYVDLMICSRLQSIPGILDAWEEQFHSAGRAFLCIAVAPATASSAVFKCTSHVVQADTYRRMKKAIKNSWQGHCPATNCLWMHYLTDVILNLKPFPVTAKQKRALRDFRSVCFQVLQPLHAYLHCTIANCKRCSLTDHTGH